MIRIIFRVCLVVFCFLTILSCQKIEDIKDSFFGNDSSLSKNKSRKKVTFSGNKSIVFVTDKNGLENSVYNFKTWQGLQRASREFKLKVSYIESKKESGYGINLQKAVKLKPGVILSVGDFIAEPTKNVAGINIKQQYAILNHPYKNPPKNILSAIFKVEESSFVVGYIAARMGRKVGFIGGIRGQLSDKFEYGFKAGVKYANPSLKVNVRYADTFNFPAKGKSLANELYSIGDSVIFSPAGKTSLGVIETAKERKKWVIGSGVDKSNLAPNSLLTSAVLNFDVLAYEIAKQVDNRTFKGGSLQRYGLKSKAVEIVNSKFIPNYFMDDVNWIEKQIIKGKIKVPKSKNEFKMSNN